MEKISIAVLQNQPGMFEDVLLCKIMNVIFLDSKYLAVFENAGFRECLKFQKRGWFNIIRSVTCVQHTPSAQAPAFFYFALLFIKPN